MRVIGLCLILLAFATVGVFAKCEGRGCAACVAEAGCFFCPTKAVSQYLYPPTHEWRKNTAGVCVSALPTDSSTTRPHCMMKTANNWITKKEECTVLAGSDDAAINALYMPRPEREMEIGYSKTVATELAKSSTFTCAKQYSCIDCLMQQPTNLLPFSATPYCNFCPKAYMKLDKFDGDTRDRRALGACVQGAGEVEKGDCIVSSGDLYRTNIAHDKSVASGFITGGKQLTYQEALAICENYKGFDFDLEKMKEFFVSGSIFSLDLETLSQISKLVFVLSKFEEDVLQLVYFRSSCPAVFSESFKDKTIHKFAGEATRAVLEHAAKEVAKELGDVVGGLGVAIDVGEWFLNRMKTLFENGGDATTQAFKDVKYSQVFPIIQKTVGTLHSTPGDLKAGLKKVVAEVTENMPGLAGQLANGFDTVWNSIGAKVTKYTALTVGGAAAGGIPAIVAIAVGLGDIILSLVTDKTQKIATDNLLRLLALTLVFHEGVLTGNIKPEGDNARVFAAYSLSTPCSVAFTGHHNLGCPVGWYCKRDWIFFPTDSADFEKTGTSDKGFCAPRTKKQLPNGAPCSMSSNCLSGFCAANMVGAVTKDETGQMKEIRVSSSDLRVRFDKSPIYFEMDKSVVVSALTGKCAMAVPLSSTLLACKEIPTSTARTVPHAFTFKYCPDAPSSIHSRSNNYVIDTIKEFNMLQGQAVNV